MGWTCTLDGKTRIVYRSSVFNVHETRQSLNLLRDETISELSLLKQAMMKCIWLSSTTSSWDLLENCSFQCRRNFKV
jgi:hypothetical protein